MSVYRWGAGWAADRNNPKIKQYYDPLHPAVLQAIKRVADVCLPLGRRVSVCGEMAADPMIALLLAGMGIREFSLSAPNIPLVKQAIRRCSIRRCRTLARGVLALDQASQVRAYLEKRRPSFINQSI
jgi:phosphotransferase system enzyme I (PtsP)